MKIYKIQRTTDNLFSTGGTYPKFTKKGKIWSAINHVTAHLTGCVHDNYYEQRNYRANSGTLLADCVLIEYDVSEKDGSSSVITKTSLATVLLEARARKEKRELQERINRDARRLQELQEEQARLQKTSLKNIQEMDKIMKRNTNV